MSGTKPPVELTTDPGPVLKLMGYDPPERSPARINSMIADYMDDASGWIKPSYNYVLKDVLEVSGRFSRIEGGVTFESAVIARLLSGCQKVAVFALTIGSTLEKFSASLSANGLVLKASVVDAVGSALAEKLADRMQSGVEAKAATLGLAISRRFSPGYCDWHVSQQRMVFKALGEQTGVIRLTPSCLMIPRKSVSGIIGLGPFGLADKYVPCRTCKKSKQCLWRRE